MIPILSKHKISQKKNIAKRKDKYNVELECILRKYQEQILQLNHKRIQLKDLMKNNQKTCRLKLKNKQLYFYSPGVNISFFSFSSVFSPSVFYELKPSLGSWWNDRSFPRTNGTIKNDPIVPKKKNAQNAFLKMLERLVKERNGRERELLEKNG